jgi:hypothetical protein
VRSVPYREVSFRITVLTNFPPQRLCGAGQQQNVWQRTLFHGERGDRCAPTTGCAASQWARLVGVARCTLDTDSQPAGLPRRRNRCLLDTRRSDGSALAEHAKVSLPCPARSCRPGEDERGVPVISTLFTSRGTSVGPEDDC